MKFAYIVMFELRSLPKTINDLYSRIIDYYDADVFLICQNQFEDDEERVKLFSRRLIKSKVLFSSLYILRLDESSNRDGLWRG